MAEDFVRIAKSKIQAYSNPNKDELSKELLRFFEVLSNVGAEFGYRSAIEIHRFASLAVHFAKDWTLKQDRKSTRLNSSHVAISYAVFCLKKKKLLLHLNQIQ